MKMMTTRTKTTTSRTKLADIPTAAGVVGASRPIPGRRDPQPLAALICSRMARIVAA